MRGKKKKLRKVSRKRISSREKKVSLEAQKLGGYDGTLVDRGRRTQGEKGILELKRNCVRTHIGGGGIPSKRKEKKGGDV